MKINTTRNRKYKNKKMLLASLGLLLILGLATGAYFVLRPKSNQAIEQTSQENSAPSSNQDVNNDAPTDEQVESGNRQKQDSVTNETPQSENIAVIFTAVNQTESTLQVRVLLEPLVSDSGECILTLSKQNERIVKTAGVQALASSSTCRGFDVALGELSAGTWNLNVAVHSGSLSGSNSQEITIP